MLRLCRNISFKRFFAVAQNDEKCKNIHLPFSIFNSPHPAFTAFTLAEVLIVVGIIGLVAEMTIPTLVQDFQKKVYVTKLKETYSIVNQALMQYAADMGCTGDLGCTGLFDDTVPNKLTEWDNFVNNYLRVAKNCRNEADKGCFATDYKHLYGNTLYYGMDASSIQYRIILNNGVSVYFRDGGTKCVNQKNVCGNLGVDVNNIEGPNRSGRDFFQHLNIAITRQGLIPSHGSQALSYLTDGTESWTWKNTTNVYYNCNPEIPSYGMGCVSRIIDEGWEMNY